MNTSSGKPQPPRHLLYPQPPPPAVPKSNLGVVPSITMPTNVMSPNDMFRANTARHADSPTFPGPVMYNGNGARTLYSPGSTSASVRSPSTKSPKTLPSLLGRTKQSLSVGSVIWQSDRCVAQKYGRYDD